MLCILLQADAKLLHCVEEGKHLAHLEFLLDNGASIDCQRLKDKVCISASYVTLLFSYLPDLLLTIVWHWPDNASDITAAAGTFQSGEMLFQFIAAEYIIHPGANLLTHMLPTG